MQILLLGHAHLVRQLIKAPKLRLSGQDYAMIVVAYVNAQNRNKETALHIATKYSQLQMVLSLLELGADLNIQDDVS